MARVGPQQRVGRQRIIVLLQPQHHRLAARALHREHRIRRTLVHLDVVHLHRAVIVLHRIRVRVARRIVRIDRSRPIIENRRRAKSGRTTGIGCCKPEGLSAFEGRIVHDRGPNLELPGGIQGDPSARPIGYPTATVKDLEIGTRRRSAIVHAIAGCRRARPEGQSECCHLSRRTSDGEHGIRRALIDQQIVDLQRPIVVLGGGIVRRAVALEDRPSPIVPDRRRSGGGLAGGIGSCKPEGLAVVDDRIVEDRRANLQQPIRVEDDEGTRDIGLPARPVEVFKIRTWRS